MLAHRTWLVTAVAVAVAVVVAAAPSAAAARKPAPPRDTQPPTAPGNVHVTAVEQASVTLAWSSSTDNVAVRQYAAWTNGHPVQYVTDTSATISGLHPGTGYTFFVEATDGTNWSAPGSTGATTAPDVAPPSAPRDLALATALYGQPVDGVTASKVLLSWTNSTDDFGPISYQVLVDGAPSPNVFDTRPPGTQVGATSTVWVRQLTPGAAHTFAVRAVDGGENSSPLSNTITATTDPNSDRTAPSTPTLTSAFDGGPGQCPEELWFTFTASTDDPPSSLEYEVRVNGTIIDVATATSWISYTAIAGVNTLTIIATDPAGNPSAPSNPIPIDVGPGNTC